MALMVVGIVNRARRIVRLHLERGINESMCLRVLKNRVTVSHIRNTLNFSAERGVVFSASVPPLNNPGINAPLLAKIGRNDSSAGGVPVHAK